MKLFERTGGHWLFWWTVGYFIVSIVDVFALDVDWFPWVQLAWLTIIALPLTYNPLARWLNMRENHMFDWFKKKSSNVVPFPDRKSVPETKDEQPAPKEKNPTIHYTIGHTDDNRVSFVIGYSTLTMNHQGVQMLIDQLEMYKNQLQTEQ